MKMPNLEDVFNRAWLNGSQMVWLMIAILLSLIFLGCLAVWIESKKRHYYE